MTELATVPVIETFGPTIQGEGALAGLPTYFVRLGGCDYRCSWCDSMYAVEPAEVRANAERLTPGEILGRIGALPTGPEWVTLSGGNPALFQLGPLVAALRAADLKVCVETQGSRWRDWLASVDHLVVSPKPPSSGMTSDAHEDETAEFVGRAEASVEPDKRSLKIVVLDADDLAWAREQIVGWGHPVYWPLAFLSVCTEQGLDTDEDTQLAVGDRYRWLCEEVAADPMFAHVRVLPQLHVIAWGTRRGV